MPVDAGPVGCWWVMCSACCRCQLGSDLLQWASASRLHGSDGSTHHDGRVPHRAMLLLVFHLGCIDWCPVEAPVRHSFGCNTQDSTAARVCAIARPTNHLCVGHPWSQLHPCGARALKLASLGWVCVVCGLLDGPCVHRSNWLSPWQMSGWLCLAGGCHWQL